MFNPANVVKTICLTEKATLLSERLNQYVFRVSPSSTKLEIKRAVEMLFQKKVVRVNTCNYLGKKRRERTAAYGRKAHWKKAIVTLKEGDKINLA